MLGIRDAEHEEEGRPSQNYIIRLVSCPVTNRADSDPRLSGACPIRIQPGTRLAAIYGREQAAEEYTCNYEVNGDYLERFERAGLRTAAWGKGGECRAVELPEHRFFIATLFQPQLAAPERQPHPFILRYLEAAAGKMAAAG